MKKLLKYSFQIATDRGYVSRHGIVTADTNLKSQRKAPGGDRISHQCVNNSRGWRGPRAPTSSFQMNDCVGTRTILWPVKSILDSHAPVVILFCLIAGKHLKRCPHYLPTRSRIILIFQIFIFPPRLVKQQWQRNYPTNSENHKKAAQQPSVYTVLQKHRNRNINDLCLLRHHNGPVSRTLFQRASGGIRWRESWTFLTCVWFSDKAETRSVGKRVH